MARCQKCGADTPPQAAVCHNCGAKIGGGKPAFAGTMMGLPSPVAGAPQATAEPEPGSVGSPGTQPARKGALGGTMIGLPGPVAAPSPPGLANPAALSDQAALAKTSAVSTPSAVSSPTGPSEGTLPLRAKHGALGQTMVGLGTPNPVRDPSVSDGTLPRGAATAPGETRQPRNPKFSGTLLGIAQPGIAPTHDGSRPAPPPSTIAAARAEVAPVLQSPPGPHSAPAPAAPRSPSSPPSSAAPARHSSHPRRSFPTTTSPWKSIALISGGMLVAAGIGGAVALLAPKPVTVVVSEFSIDESGNDRLKIACVGCSDGDTLVMNSAEAKVKNSEAVLYPKEPLKLGKNTLNFHVVTGEGKREQASAVVLPIAFRVLTAWEGRHANPPHAVVRVSAPNGTSVKIAGQTIPVKDQLASLQIPFEKESLGEAKSVESVTASVPVVVTVDGKERHAQAELKAGVTPLTLTSPAPRHQLGGQALTVEGQTSPDALVTVGTQELRADKKGFFRVQLVGLNPQELEVTSRSENLLRRRVVLQLEKKTTAGAGAITKFDELKVGQNVSILGTVVESRVAYGTTRALLEVQSGCGAPPCLLRAVYGEPLSLRANRQVRVLGHVLGGSPLTIRAQVFR